MDYDFIIIGQGLAGSILAYQLLEKGKKVKIVDKFRENTSSKVAAGLVNPITGRRFAKTWMADDIIPFAESFYSEIENKLDDHFYIKTPLLRILGSTEDQNTWMGRTQDPSIKEYIKNDSVSDIEGVEMDFGAAELNKSAYLKTELFLLKIRAYFKELNVLDEKEIEVNELNELNCDSILGYSANKIIFCEGYYVFENSIFNWLPFTFAKGEVFDLEINNFQEDSILNKNGFILPLGNGEYKAGATFRWNEMDEEVTERSKEELVEKVEKIINVDYKIKNQRASVRPTVRDRRPFIGQHPEFSKFYIFNGMGSKGVSLIPYFANHLVTHLVGNTELMKEVDISRYYKFYSEKC